MAGHIGITQRVAHLKDIDERRDCLDQAWTRLLQNSGFTPIVIPNELSDPQEYLSQLSVQGIIFTGGNDLASLPDATAPAPERDAMEAELFTICGAKKIPLLGVCRGMQHLLLLDGCKPAPVEAHVGNNHQVKLESDNCTWLPTAFTTNSYHNWGYPNIDGADHYEVVARADDSTVEAIQHLALPIRGIMWHPERDPINGLSQSVITDLFNDHTPG